MTTCQLFSFSIFSATIDRPYGMNHMLCRQPPARRYHRLPSRQASNLANNSPAFDQYRRSASLVNGAIDSAST